MTTQDYAIQASKGIKKSFENGLANGLAPYMDNGIIDFHTTSEWNEIFTSTEGLTGTKQLAELETPPTNALEDGYEVILSPERFGNSIIVSETMQLQAKDNTTKIDLFLQRQRNALLLDVTHTLLNSAFYMLNNAFNSSALTLAPDGVELCGAHTYASGGTFDNGVTAALDSGAVDAAQEYAGAFTSPSGKPMPLNLDTIIVKKGSDAERTAVKLFASNISPTAIGDINLYEGMYKILATPYITSTNKNYWFMRDSSKLNSMVLGINKMPSLGTPQVEKNLSVYTPVTGFWKRGINNMPTDIYGSNGTT